MPNEMLESMYAMPVDVTLRSTVVLSRVLVARGGLAVLPLSGLAEAEERMQNQLMKI